MHALLSEVQRFVSAEVLVVLTALSIVFFLGSLIVMAIILVRMPADFFDARVPRSPMKDRHPVLRLAGHLLKNILGAIFLFAGFLMLFLPGQGVLTMLIGVSMLDFPGKLKLERKILGQPTVLNSVNGIRRKFGRPPLIIVPDS